MGWRQRGFVKGRIITESVVDVEAHALVHQMVNDKDNGIMLMDFGAAFPSLLHAWILFVLGCMGIDDRILRFFAALYADSSATILLRGRLWFTILMGRGVRQGCPASGCIFALACDLLFRWLAERATGPGAELRAYADDLAFAVRSLLHTLPRLARAFIEIERASGLWLKHRKCVILLLGNMKWEELAEFVGKLLHGFSSISIARHAIYLGMDIGSGAWHDRWNGVVSKCSAVVDDIRAMELGFVRCVILYNRHAAPLWQYIAQLYLLNKEATKCEDRMLQRMTGAPRHAFSGCMMNGLKAHGP